MAKNKSFQKTGEDAARGGVSGGARASAREVGTAAARGAVQGGSYTTSSTRKPKESSLQELAKRRLARSKNR